MQSNFQTLRVKMVDGQLRTTDVTNHELLSAFLSVPRELFVGDARADLAYLDDDIQISAGRYLMEPSPLAKLLQLAEIKPHDKVLIVGAATGYSAAIVAQLATNVVALECDDALLQQCKANLAAVKAQSVVCVSGALNGGAPANGPYDVIIIEGSVASVPTELMAQLGEAGRLVVVEGQGLTGVANCYLKSGNSLGKTRGFNVAVKPLPGFEPKITFAF